MHIIGRKSAVLTAFVVAILGNLSLCNYEFAIAPAAAQDLVLTTHRLAIMKGALRLTTAQKPYWHVLEATVRGIAAQQASQDGSEPRVVPRAITLTDEARQQIAAAAQPLIKTLDDNQKRDGSAALRSMGVALPF
jgi:hypothetical protein